MGINVSSSTGSALLVLLRNPSDPQAWSAFVERYAPVIYGWCRRWRLQDADAQDVTQDVMTKLARRLRTFAYDPQRGSFRGWLWTLTRHAWSDYREKQQRAGLGCGPAAAAEMQTLAARDSLLEALEHAFDLEVLDEAKARVRLQVSPRDWQIFQALAVDGLPAAAVAPELGITVFAARMAKKRVQDRLRAEIHRLEATTAPYPE